MNLSFLFSLQKRKFKLLLLLVFILTTITLLTSFSKNKNQEKIKSRFPSLAFDIDVAEGLRRLPKYHHFVFQLVGEDKSGALGRRRVYSLVVYAVDSIGNPIDPDYRTQAIDATPLRILSTEKDKDRTDRNDEIKLCNYLMSDENYSKLVNDTTLYLQFDASIRKTDNKRIFDGYITYEVCSVANDGSKIEKNNLLDPNFLKPSPPAKPSGE